MAQQVFYAWGGGGRSERALSRYLARSQSALGPGFWRPGAGPEPLAWRPIEAPADAIWTGEASTSGGRRVGRVEAMRDRSTGAFAAGLLLGPALVMLSQLAPPAWRAPDRVAAAVMAADRWSAGARMMQNADPERWRRLMDGAALEGLARAERDCRHTHRPPGCTLPMPLPRTSAGAAWAGPVKLQPLTPLKPLLTSVASVDAALDGPGVRR